MARPSHRSAEAVDDRHAHLREVGAEAADEETHVAAELSQARRSRRIDLHDAARELCIRFEHLEALEERRFEDLPGRAYALGFLRSYATYLGLDADHLVARFKAETADFGGRQKLHFPAPVDEGRAPKWPLVLLALALAAAVYAGWYYLTTRDRVAFDTVPRVPASLAVRTPSPDAAASQRTPSAPRGAPAAERGDTRFASAAAMTEVGGAAKAPAPLATSAPRSARADVPRVFGQGNAGSRIQLRATSESWVLVADPDSGVLFEKSLSPGEVYSVPDRPGLLLTTGNAGGLDIMVGGKVAPSIGPFGAVRRNVALDSHKLLAGEALAP